VPRRGDYRHIRGPLNHRWLRSTSLTYLPDTLDSSRPTHGSAEVGIGIQSGAQGLSRCWR